MRTAKCIAIHAVAALAGMIPATVATGQPAPATPVVQPSNTRQASCIVRITVDPAIMPLNAETVSALIHSPAVLLKAGRDVLSLDTPEDFNRLDKSQESGRPLIFIKWLDSSVAPAVSTTRSGQQSRRTRYDGEAMTMKEFEDAYGGEYMMMGQVQNKRGEVGPTKGPSDGDSGLKPGQRSSGAGGGMTGGFAGIAIGGMSGKRTDAVGGMGGGYGGIGANPYGSPGGVIGGVTGGRGMGGFGGAMAGGGGTGMSNMSFYGELSDVGRQSVASEQSATIELQVSLPDTVPPLAEKFLGALVANLQAGLSRAYETYSLDLRHWLGIAKDQSCAAEAALEGATDDSSASPQVKEHLDTIVDLSALSPQMPFGEALDMLRKSVQPALQIAALWKDLERFAAVEPSTTVGIEGLPNVRLGTALDLLLKGVSPQEGGPVYEIKGDVIVIGTPSAFDRSDKRAELSALGADTQTLTAQRNLVVRKMQDLELTLSGMEARQNAIQEQVVVAKQQASRQLADDPVTRELEKLVALSTTSLEWVKQSVKSGRSPTVDLSQAQESLAKANIDLARRREELMRSAGGNQLEQYNGELSQIAIDRAEKQAQAEILRRQLDELQRQLAQALTFDPEAVRTRIAREALDIANRRVLEIQTRLAALRPPTAVTIGAN